MTEPDPLKLLFGSDERAAEQLRDAQDKLTSYFAWRGFADAEDCTSEVFLRAITRLSSGTTLEHPDNPMRFLYGIARNIAFEAGRDRKRRSQHEPIDNYAEQLESHSTIETVLYTQEALDTLSPHDRELLLEYIDGDRKALQRRLNTSAAALRVKICNIRNALKRLRKKS